MTERTASRPEGEERGNYYRNPHEVAEILNVSSSGLRRLAEIYASVRGEFPRDPKTRTRLWPQEAVSELATARALVQANRVPSIREALEALRRGDVPQTEGGDFEDGQSEHGRPGDGRGMKRPGVDVFSELLQELAALRSEITSSEITSSEITGGEGTSSEMTGGEGSGSAVTSVLAELRGEIAELSRELSNTRSELAEMRRELVKARSGTLSSDAKEQAELQEMRRRLRYLQAELEIREL